MNEKPIYNGPKFSRGDKIETLKNCCPLGTWMEVKKDYTHIEFLGLCKKKVLPAGSIGVVSLISHNLNKKKPFLHINFQGIGNLKIPLDNLKKIP